uniref:Maestro heat-like repeat-containing protein family member 1 n=1 Tax=Strigamia maritima TaxID=126957 RepID=T1JN14_STRMM
MPILKCREDMLSEMLTALVDSANDKNDEVQQAICDSLQVLGIRKPELVLATCSSYLTKHPKLPTKHRIVILKTIYKVCDEAQDFNSKDLSCMIIKQATEEMISSKDIIPEWQGAASNVLVSVGRKWCHPVMENLLIKFQPGVVPHFFIIQTLAHLASKNVYEMVPFLKSVLGTLLSVISVIHHENMKWVTAFAVARFGDAVTEYIANIDKAPDPSVKKEVYETEFNVAYDNLINWLPGKDMKLRTMIIEALGSISHIVSREKFEERLGRVISIILTIYKKPHSQLNIVTQSFCMILDAGFENRSTVLDTQVESIINILFPQICGILDYTEPSLIKNHNEVLRCFCLLENHIHDKMPNILALMKVVVLDNNNKVKQCLAHLIVSLAHHGYLELDAGPILVEFLIRQCSSEQSFENINELSIRGTCENALHIISTTVPNIETILSGEAKQHRHSTLQLMKAVAPTFHKNLVPTMDAQIPQLLALSADGQNLRLHEWENYLLDFLSQILNDLDEEDWCKALGRALANQIETYKDLPQSKAFLFKCLGEITKKVNDEVFCRMYLEAIFSSTQHTDETEREGCASAFGRNAISHFDTSLITLQSLAKNDTSRRHSGIFSFFMDSRSDGEQEAANRCTLILCYGYVSSSCPSANLAACLEPVVLKYLMSQFKFAQKSSDTKMCLLRALSLLTGALNPSQFNVSTMSLPIRLELINHIQQFLKDANGNDAINLSLKCITNLIQLEPILPAAEWEKCLRICTEKVYTSSQITELPTDDSLKKLNRLLHTLLERDPTSENLYFISCYLECWLSSEKVQERKQSILSLVKLLEDYLTIYSKNGEVTILNITRFSPMGSILARLVPRCSDTDVLIRQTAVSGISTLFRLAACFDGLSTEYFESTLNKLDMIRSRLSTEVNVDVLFQTITSLGQLVASNLPSHQVIPFLHALFDGLLDPVNTCSVGVEVLLQLLHRQLNSIDYVNTRKVALQIVRNIASHHLIAVVDFLLGCSTPFDSASACSWQALAQDSALNTDVLTHLLQNLNLNTPCVYEITDPRHNKDKLCIATPQSIAVLYALKEMFQQAEMESAAIANFSQLFTSFILISGMYVDAFLPPPPDFKKSLWPPPSALKTKDKTSPIRVVEDTLRAFLLCARLESILHIATEDGCWSNLESHETFPDAVVCLSNAVCVHAPESLSSIVSLLSPAISSSVEVHRVLSLVYQRCNNDTVLLELVMNSLVNMLIDASTVVRRLSIRGLGHIVELGADEIQKYSTTVLSAMLVGLDDKDDFKGDIALESMGGLSKMLVEIDSGLVAPVLISIKRPDVRQAAFKLFGDLSKFAIGESEAGFVEQIQNNLVPLLLHLNDEDKNVIKACKHSLRCVGPLLDCSPVNTMVQRHLIPEGELHYGEFMNDLSKILVTEFSNKIPLYVTSNVMYFKSSWAIIQANAAMFVGYLLCNLPEQVKLQIDREATCTALMLLLKCEDKQVRIKAAEAMSLLHQY